MSKSFSKIQMWLLIFKFQRQQRQQLKRFYGCRYQVCKVQSLWGLIHTFPKLIMRCENLLRGSYVKLIHPSWPASAIASWLFLKNLRGTFRCILNHAENNTVRQTWKEKLVQLTWPVTPVSRAVFFFSGLGRPFESELSLMSLSSSEDIIFVPFKCRSRSWSC